MEPILSYHTEESPSNCCKYMPTIVAKSKLINSNTVV